MSFHPSPVLILKSKRKDLKKVWKLAYSFKLVCSLTLANKYTPITAYKYRFKNRTPPTLKSSGIAFRNVIIMIF